MLCSPFKIAVLGSSLLPVMAKLVVRIQSGVFVCLLIKFYWYVAGMIALGSWTCSFPRLCCMLCYKGKVINSIAILLYWQPAVLPVLDWLAGVFDSLFGKWTMLRRGGNFELNSLTCSSFNLTGSNRLVFFSSFCYDGKWQQSKYRSTEFVCLLTVFNPQTTKHLHCRCLLWCDLSDEKTDLIGKFDCHLLLGSDEALFWHGETFSPFRHLRVCWSKGFINFSQGCVCYSVLMRRFLVDCWFVFLSSVGTISMFHLVWLQIGSCNAFNN